MLVLKFYENFVIFWNFIKFPNFILIYIFFEILSNFWNFENLDFLEILKFYYPLSIIINIYWTPSLTMVYRPPNPWYFDPPAHGISTPLPMVYQTLSYGSMNSSLLVEMRGGSIYHEGVQNTMTKNWTWGQNTIWKIEPGVKIS